MNKSEDSAKEGKPIPPQPQSMPATSPSIDESLYLNSKKDFTPNKYEDYGLFFYPQRFGSVRTPEWYEKFFSYGSSREILNKSLCEENVAKCLQTRIIFSLLNFLKKKYGPTTNFEYIKFKIRELNY